MRAGLQVKYNEEAADASESQTADLAKSLDKQKEETSTKAFEGQKQVLDDDKKETTAAMEANKTETAAASEAQTVVFAKRCRIEPARVSQEHSHPTVAAQKTI